MTPGDQTEDPPAQTFRLHRRRESVTAEEVLRWMRSRPGASWEASISDIERAIDEICAEGPRAMTDKVMGLFFANIVRAVTDMRKAGLSDGEIACIVGDIRSAALHEERLRSEIAVKDNPPKHPTWVEMRDALNDFIERPRAAGEGSQT